MLYLLSNRTDKGIDQELSDAISRFKKRIEGKELKEAQGIGGVMRQLFGEVLAKNYGRVHSLVQISAARVFQAKNMKELSKAFARLAYSQDAYKKTSMAAILCIDALEEVKNVEAKKRRYWDTNLLDYSYDELLDELDHLNNQWQKYSCGHIVQRLERIKEEIGIDTIKITFSEVKGLFYTVRHGIINKKRVIPVFRKKKVEKLLNYIKNGKIFEDVKKAVGDKVAEETKEGIKERLKRLIVSRTFLIKNGRFGVMGLSRQVELLAMALRMRALGMIAEKENNGITVEESFTWCTGGMQTLSHFVSDEKMEEIAESKSVKDIKELALTVMEENSLSMLFEEKTASSDKDVNTIEQLKRLIETKDPEGNDGELNELKTKLSKEKCKNIVDGIKDTALRLASAVKRNKKGQIVTELTTDGKERPVLTVDAKEQIKVGLMRNGFPERAAEEMCGHLEEAIQKEMAKRLAAETPQDRKRGIARTFMVFTPLGLIGLLIHKIITFIMSNMRCKTLLQNSFTNKAVKKLKKGKVGGYVNNIVQNFYTGFIVGLMSFIGMVIGTLVVRFTTDANGLKEALKGDGDKDLGDALRENSPLLGFLWFKFPTVAWTAISAVLFPLMLVLISHKYLKEISLGKGGAAIFTGLTGIGAYATMNGKGMFGNIPFFVSLSGMLWIWDEFDDFQDAKDRITKENDPTGLVDYAELFLLPFILGFFGAMFGMTDPMALVIPGRLGFMKYTTDALVQPWNWILHALYQVVATLIGGIVASGGIGGFAVYMIGSILANFAMRGVMSVIM